MTECSTVNMVSLLLLSALVVGSTQGFSLWQAFQKMDADADVDHFNRRNPEELRDTTAEELLNKLVEVAKNHHDRHEEGHEGKGAEERHGHEERDGEEEGHGEELEEAETRISHEAIGRVLDHLIRSMTTTKELQGKGLVARACGADTCAHGTCSTEHIQGYDFGCDCDKDWFGIKCDKKDPCESTACGSSTCYGTCPKGTAHCMPTSSHPSGHFCYDAGWKSLRSDHTQPSREMAKLALRLATAAM